MAEKPFTFECAACGKQTSVTAGTIMHGSKLPLTAWFWAAWLMASHSNGISALQLRNQLGLGSYKSAWLLCAKLRRAMVATGRSPLAGLAEVDETEIPLRTKDDPVAGGGGRSHEGKMLVAGAVEVADGGAPGRIRLAEITDFSAPSLHGFIAANVAPGTTIRTDGWSGYPGAPDVAHDPHVIGPMAAHVVLPWIHRVFSNLKTWALGVYHGLRKKHLQAYLDEFVFRFNRRRTRHAAFRSLLGIGVTLKHVTYNMLIQPEAQA
jgi:ISXO2 transposase-like protein